MEAREEREWNEGKRERVCVREREEEEEGEDSKIA